MEGVIVNFSDGHANYFDAWEYVTEDPFFFRVKEIQVYLLALLLEHNLLWMQEVREVPLWCSWPIRRNRCRKTEVKMSYVGLPMNKNKGKKICHYMYPIMLKNVWNSFTIHERWKMYEEKWKESRKLRYSYSGNFVMLTVLWAAVDSD